MSSVDADRTAAARIRDTALGLFAQRGVDGTSIRAVAEAAEVSPALVMHHFGSKDGLRNAVDQRCTDVVTEVVERSLEVLGAGNADLAEQIQAAFTPAVDVIGYLGRAISDGGPSGRAFVDQFLRLADRTTTAMAEAGMLRDELTDLRMVAAVALAMDVGMFVLRPHLREYLGGDLLDPDVSSRWIAVQADVFAGGVLRASAGAS